MNRGLINLAAIGMSSLAAILVAAVAPILPTTRPAMSDKPTTQPASCSIDNKGACGETHWKSKTEAEWRKLLTPEQYRVAREAGTERAFTGKYWDTKTKGIYHCAGCKQALFASETKFDSGTGWPSFWQPVTETAVVTHEDKAHGMVRTEIRCSQCNAHLGHVFNDGPKPTGLRYCLNSAVLHLVPADPLDESKP